MNDVENYAEAFHQHWMRLSTKLYLQADQSLKVYEHLWNAYTEPQRAYHTVQHIVECLELLQPIYVDLHDPITVEIAIWFHDVIYEPKSSENEIRSANLMKQLCGDILNQQQLEKVHLWILATQHHQPTLDHDLQYLLDIDLAILASSKERFNEYEQQTRFEYAWVESEIYQMKRQAVLQYFADMEPLYQTLYFQQHFEKQAKINLKKVMV